MGARYAQGGAAGWHPRSVTATVNEDVVTQHAELAGFLWTQRDRAVAAPHYSLQDLVDLDERLEANLDGLRIAADVGWELCLAHAEAKGPGAIFAAAVLAIESETPIHLERVYALASEAKRLRELIAAFGWIDPQRLHGRVLPLLSADSSVWRRIGLRVCAIHRVDPKQFLLKAIVDPDPDLRAAALRTIGELKLQDRAELAFAQLGLEDPQCRFWSAWSSVLLGDRGRALSVLESIASSDSIFKLRAMSMFLRATGLDAATAWLRARANSVGSIRAAIDGAGMVGDPLTVPWLIGQMDVPERARAAGEAFAFITGADLAYQDLEVRPRGEPEIPEPDTLSPDDDLPLPDPALVGRWWADHRSRWRAGVRHLNGKEISTEWLWGVLLHGKQRARIAAALELALRDDAQPLFEVRARGKVQLVTLGLRPAPPERATR